jgi:hypothetical protein
VADNDYADRVRTAVAAVEFTGPTGFKWFGKLLGVVDDKTMEYVDHENVNLITLVQQRLYESFYCPGFATPIKALPPPLPDGAAQARFVAALSRANSGQGTWESGWTVEQFGESEAIVEGQGVRVTVMRSELRPIRNGRWGLDQPVVVSHPKESLRESPGFYLAFGDCPFEEGDDRHLLRVYFNLRCHVAPSFMHLMTRRLNSAGTPFRLKVISHPGPYYRNDVSVLYISRRSWTGVAKLLSSMLERLGEYLRPPIPMFTKRLGYGIGFAENVLGKESFGESRCRILAAGLDEARRNGQLILADRFATVVRRFSESGVRLSEPYLNPGSLDNYTLTATKRVLTSRTLTRAPEGRMAPGSALDVAAAVGRRICRQAVWNKDQCTWLTVDPPPTGNVGRSTSLTLRAVGPHVYAGTSGIALFLAKAFKATGDREFERTALGSLTSALSVLQAEEQPSRLGLFTGLVGSAFACARAAADLNQPVLLEEALTLASSSRVRCRTGIVEHDLLSGSAGTILALLGLRRLSGDNSFLIEALFLADEICEAARHSERGLSWSSSSSGLGVNLTGYSHGTAGIAHALTELELATGKPIYGETALGAFEYERSWFDSEVCNWPYFSRDTEGVRSDYVTQWCHGAAGIALSRLRYLKARDNPNVRQEAITATRTTADAVREWLSVPESDFSLCHGLAGNADVLLYGSEVLNDQSVALRDLAETVGEVGRDEYAYKQVLWPCGLEAIEQPGLMLGLAGIGYFYLRLWSPAVPSVLVVESA